MRIFDVRRVLAAVALTTVLAGCDKVTNFHAPDRAWDEAERKRSAGEYRAAIGLYEKALAIDGKTAEAHFRLGMIYDANLDDAVSALHHFKRYVEMQPNGAHAKEARANLDRIELKLATNLAGGTLINHTEAMKLRQANQELRDQLAQRNAAQPFVGSSSTPTPPGKVAAREAQLHPAPGTRSYEVKPGDSLASISRKFYKTPTRAKDIQDANINAVPDARKLKPGMTLIIPQ